MKHYEIKYYALDLLEKLTIFSPAAVALYFLIRRFSVLGLILLILAATYAAMYGEQIGDFFGIRKIRIERKAMARYMTTGSLPEGKRMYRFRRFRAMITMRTSFYYFSERYKLYSIAHYLGMEKKLYEAMLNDYGNKKLLSHDIKLILEYFHTHFLQAIIAHDFITGYALLNQLKIMAVGTDLVRHESVERFRSYTSVPGLDIDSTYTMTFIQLENKIHLKAIQAYYQKLECYVSYLENPSDENLQAFLTYHDQMYLVAKAVALRALYEIALEIGNQKHARLLRLTLFEMPLQHWAKNGIEA